MGSKRGFRRIGGRERALCVRFRKMFDLAKNKDVTMEDIVG